MPVCVSFVRFKLPSVPLLRRGLLQEQSHFLRPSAARQPLEWATMRGPQLAWLLAWQPGSPLVRPLVQLPVRRSWLLSPLVPELLLLRRTARQPTPQSPP